MFAALFSFLGVAVITYGATTISTNIDTGGTLTVSGNATSTFGTGGLTVGTSQFVVQQTSGNVGIGTTSPTSRLTIGLDADAGTTIANMNFSKIALSSATNDWAQVNTDGFGDTNNIQTNYLIASKGYLYAAVYNSTDGTGIYRTSDGSTWTQANTSGFGSASTIETYTMASFNGFLYAGTQNTVTGAQIWRTSDDGTTWAQVNTSGFGSTNNTRINELDVFKGYLYAATKNSTDGTQIWRSSDGTTWAQVNTSGFGDNNNTSVYDLSVFRGYLYAGTQNTTDGAEVWRTNNGTTWAQVNTSGFGDSNNVQIYSMNVFKGYLYAGTLNTTDGAEVWRTNNGTTWTQANTSGFDGNNSSDRVLRFVVYNNYLYTSSGWDAVNGAEIWRTSDGTTWAHVNAAGFGDGDNKGIYGLSIFNGYLYAGTTNNVDGTRIFRVHTGLIDSDSGSLVVQGISVGDISIEGSSVRGVTGFNVQHISAQTLGVSELLDVGANAYFGGNVGIGTTTPQTKLQISNGVSATTTVTIGELGLSTSKACVNMNQADDGSPGSFYIANDAIVVEANYCR